MDGLTNIYLGGALGVECGSHWRLLVNSPAEAIRAIDVNLGGKLRRYLSTEGAKKFYQIAVGHEENALEKEEVTNRSGQADIYILPIVAGAKSGLGKIFAAIAIAVITYYTAGAGSAGAAGIFGDSASAVASAGYTMAASLALGGVTQLLTPTPNFNQTNEGATAGSTLFNGNATAVAQGQAVALVYGRALVTPMPVCISFSNQDVTLVNGNRVSSKAGTTSYCRVELEGGGYQWVPRNEDGTCPAGSSES